MTAHMILQRQRDYIIQKNRLNPVSLVKQFLAFDEMRRMTVALRKCESRRAEMSLTDFFHTETKKQSSGTNCVMIDFVAN